MSETNGDANAEVVAMATLTATRSMDRRGKSITTYVVFNAAVELATMAEGEVLELVADDDEPIERDIGAWCRTRRHELITSEATAEGRRFLIKKGSEPVTGKRFAMVMSSAGLEELLSPLGFPLAAALEGIEVHLFLQGLAVRVLASGFEPKLSGWARPFSRFAAAGMNRTGHIPAQDKLRQLLQLGGHVYACGPSMQHFKVTRHDFVFEEVAIVEYLSFMEVLAEADIQLYS